MEQNALIKHLTPFRRRVRLVLAWKYSAVGGTIGLIFALLTDLGDWLGKWEAQPISIAFPIAIGLLSGIVYALVRFLPAEAVAQLIDRRAELKDRVTTALLCSETPFTEPQQGPQAHC
jgi:hypothetical protein